MILILIFYTQGFQILFALQAKISSFKWQQCTKIDRALDAIQRVVGQLSTSNHSWVMKVFLKSIVRFFGWSKYIKNSNEVKTCTVYQERSNINIVQKFGHVQNICAIYRPGTSNLHTRTVTFPDQKKLKQKVDLRYLKTLKPKKLNTTNSQIKHVLTFPMWWHADLICRIYIAEKNR